MRCEGWRRYGGMFTFGKPVWEQCKNDAIVILEVKQEQIEKMPSCMDCWKEAIDRKIEILSASPLDKE
jgi:hypothetical protein